MSLRIVLALAAAFVVLAVPRGAHADLMGDTVNSSITPPIWISVPPSAVVGPGPEFSLVLTSVGKTFFSVDVGNSSIALNYVDIGSLNMGAGETYVLSDLDWVGTPGTIVGASLATFGPVTGFTQSDISFTNDSVTMVLSGSLWFPNASAVITLDVRHAEVIPEPNSLVLSSLAGLAGLGYAWRRRKASAAA